MSNDSGGMSNMEQGNQQHHTTGRLASLSDVFTATTMLGASIIDFRWRRAVAFLVYMTTMLCIVSLVRVFGRAGCLLSRAVAVVLIRHRFNSVSGTHRLPPVCIDPTARWIVSPASYTSCGRGDVSGRSDVIRRMFACMRRFV